MSFHCYAARKAHDFSRGSMSRKDGKGTSVGVVSEKIGDSIIFLQLPIDKY